MASNIPQNTTCQDYYTSPALNITGFVLTWVISKCMEERSEGRTGREVADLVMKIAMKYFTSSKQVIILYDESWDINDIVNKLGSTTTKAFVLYFFPLDPELEKRIHSKPSEHDSHKIIPKANSFVVFAKDENGFMNLLRQISQYPWWNIRARLLVLVKEKGIEPTKGVLGLMESERIFSGIVVTEVVSHGNETKLAPTNPEMEAKIPGAAFQITALDPYPAPGQPTQFMLGRYMNGKFSSERPLFTEKTDNLRGFKLRVSVVEFPPLVVKTKVSKDVFHYTGLEVSILEVLAHYINFTYEIYEGNVEERYGTDMGNGSWSGLVGNVAENIAQIGFGSVFLLNNREKVVDVSVPYDQDRGCFAVPRPEALQHWMGLVLPFSWQVWACFLAMALIAGPIFSGITRPLKVDKTLSVGRGIMYALGAMVSAQQAPKAKSSALRAFIIAWLVFCWLGCILYRVALIVSLTSGPSDYKIDTMADLARSELEWGGYEETFQSFEVTNLTTKGEQEFLKRFIPIKNISAALDRVATEGDFAVIESGKFLQYAAQVKYFDGYRSALHITKECPTVYNVGFIMPIGSPYYDRVNALLRRFQNAGLIDKWLRDIMYEAILKNPNLKTTGKRSYGLSLNHLKLCFVLLLFGFFFGSVSLFIERQTASYRNKKMIRIALMQQRRTPSIVSQPSSQCLSVSKSTSASSTSKSEQRR